MKKTGSNVVLTESGAISLTGMGSVRAGDFHPGAISAHGGLIQMGQGCCDAWGDQYTLVSGPHSFGSGGTFFADTASGDFVGVFGFGYPQNPGQEGCIDVPYGYVSGAALSATMTFNNATFASLGVTPGHLRVDVGDWSESEVHAHHRPLVGG